jgi:hypothetical protein
MIVTERLEILDRYRSNWEQCGPWETEPDQVEWIYTSKAKVRKNLPCLITRGIFGNLCGYVGVPNQIQIDEIEVHGGITWDRDRLPNTVESVFNDTNFYWYGFDCAHICDLVPGQPLRGLFSFNTEYRTIQYVTDECERLAEQLCRLIMAQ